MISVDYEEVAKKIVTKCMRIKEDEVIRVVSGIPNLELAENIAVNIAKIGAFPTSAIYTDRLEKRLIEEVPKKHLKKTRKFFLKWLDDIDGFISIDPYVDPRILSKLPEDKIGAQREGNRPINDKFIELGIRWTGIGFPTREKAEMFNIDFEEFWDMFWRALNTDYDKLYEEGNRIADRLRNADKIHLTSEKGTDLEFSIKGRKILVDDGIISDEDIKNKDVGNNLPCGEVFVAPIETSANGRAVFDLAFNRGNKITDIDVNFKNGKLSKIKSKENEKLLKDVIKNSQGAKDVIGELGIGINPEVRKAIGYTITDEKIIGTIHIAVGENRMFGGKNESTLHWDWVMMSPTMEVDGKTIMEDGKIII